MIPKIIHQSWKVAEVPERWLTFQQSWLKHHPDYEYRFWTDDDNQAFIAKEFPELLPLYKGYRHPVSRADLARYLVVCHYGGIYADLDLEALKPIGDLIAGKKLVFGLEPHSHVDKPLVTERGLKRIVCNAFFAAEPRHPFWKHLIPVLMASGGESDVLEAAGPFMLTRACDSFRLSDAITILPSQVLFPIDHFLKSTIPLADSDAIDGPYTIHHWAGSWWRDSVLINAWRRIVAARMEEGSREAG
jgi:hypothetical protein